MDTLGKRIKALRGKDSQDTFADLLGISRGALSFYERDESQPGAGVLAKICALRHVSPNWLLFGAGHKYRDAPDPDNSLEWSEHLAEPEGEGYAKNRDESSLVLVPLVEARLAAGHGSFEVGAEIERHYAFRRDFLTRKGQPSQMVLMRVAGDSMAPEIKDADVVLIDQSQCTPRPGKVYAVGVEDMVYLKSLNAEPGKLILTSFNPAYRPIEVCTSEDCAEQVRIIGRAVWVGRELD